MYKLHNQLNPDKKRKKFHKPKEDNNKSEEKNFSSNSNKSFGFSKKNKNSFKFKNKKRDSRRNSDEFEKKDDAIILYGKHPVISALKNKNRKKLKLFLTKNGLKYLEENLSEDFYKNVEKQFCEPDKLERIIGDSENKILHQGMALKTFPLYKNTQLNTAEHNRVIILDDITDPHNIGAIIRSAKAFDFDCVVAEEKNSPNENATISKTSAGVIEQIPYIRVASMFNQVTELKNSGYQIFGLDRNGENLLQLNLEDSSSKIAVVIGSEGKGLSPHLKRICDKIISIGINNNVESLNASVACAIMLYKLNNK